MDNFCVVIPNIKLNQYNEVKQNGNTYHSISMMNDFKNFSFEEIRLALPEPQIINCVKNFKGFFLRT